MRQHTRSALSRIVVVVAVVLMGALSLHPLFAAENGVLRMACQYEDAKTMDPHRAAASQDRLAAGMMFNGLLQTTPGNLAIDTIMPDLALAVPRPAIVNGRQQWVFKLKHGVMTHAYPGGSGYELTSEDVVYSLQRAADPKRSSFAIDYEGMSSKALDRYTVQVTVDKPLSAYLFLPKFANRGGGLIVPKKILEEKGEQWFRTHPVGTGPFIFTKYIPAEKTVFTANKNYFKGAPKLAGVELYYMPNDSSREMALRKGELDVVAGPREEVWGVKMAGYSGVQVEYTTGGEALVVHFNMSIRPLNQLKVRQAMAYAINRDEFLKVYGTRLASPIYSVVPSGMSVAGLTKAEAEKEKAFYEYNPEKAKRLLAEAGFPNGFSLQVFTSQNAIIKSAYELLQAELRRIGIDVKLSIVDHSTFHERIRQDLDPIVVYSAMRPDPDTILTEFYHSDSIVKTGKKATANFSHIGAVDADGDGKIDSIDDLILRARTEQNPTKQLVLWKQAQVELLKKQVSYPVITAGYVFAENPKVKWGFKMVNIVDGPIPTEATQIAKQ